MNDTAVPNKKANIMIIDDVPTNLQVLSEFLKNKAYKVRPVTNGKMALQAMQIEPPDLILLDITMPDMSGFEVCEILKKDENLKNIPVIFISAIDGISDKVKAFKMGGVDYITKPFQYEEVLARVDTQLSLYQLQGKLKAYNKQLEELIQKQVKEISDSQMATIFAIAKLAESRDEDTGTHLERVQKYCRILALKLREKEPYRTKIDDYFIRDIFQASPLHDIGKVAIPDAILLKQGKLTPEEFEVMKTHTSLGSDTLKAVNVTYPNNSFINMGIEISRSHHERWDGKGYPDGLSGGDIPLCARIMAVADVYDALRSKRCYKPPFEHDKSRDIILEGKGAQFDPIVVDAFEEIHMDFREITETLME
ncbi:MAG: two-component system response regulator [Spirochaetes bacterium GWF1_49_6]|nr:MAG: two-component system response regulator [Spirochaetes bacterium GWF1_49_6]